MNRLFASGSQSTGASASASVLPINIELISFRIDWLDLLAVQETLEGLLQHHNWKTSIFFGVPLSLWFYSHVTPGKSIALTIRSWSSKCCLCFFICCLSCHSFPCKERASFYFMAAVAIYSVLGAPKRKSVSASTYPPSTCHEVMGLNARILVCLMLNFKPAFSLSLFTFIKTL